MHNMSQFRLRVCVACVWYYGKVAYFTINLSYKIYYVSTRSQNCEEFRESSKQKSPCKNVVPLYHKEKIKGKLY